MTSLSHQNDKKLTELTQQPSLFGTDLLYFVRGGTSYSILASALGLAGSTLPQAVLTSAAAGTTLVVDDSSGFEVGMDVVLELDNGELHATTVATLPATTGMTLTTAPPSAASSGRNIQAAWTETVVARTALNSNRTDLDLHKVMLAMLRHVYYVDGFMDYANVNAGGDITADLQLLFNAIPADGGYVVFGSDTYRFAGIQIQNKTTVIGQGVGNTILERSVVGAAGTRGMFMVENYTEAHFEVSGCTFELNDEAFTQIGVAGRFANAYAINAAGFLQIAGSQPNSAVYALESSHIYVHNCEIVNTAESGMLFRNCAHIRVHNCIFDNTSGWGIEFSFIDGFGGGFVREWYEVSGCQFRNIFDLGLGGGNAGAVAFAGAATGEVFRHGRVVNNFSENTDRGICHTEFNGGSTFADLIVSGNQVYECHHQGVTINHALMVTIEGNTIYQPGSSVNYLNSGNPDVNAIRLGNSTSVHVRNNTIRDDREKDVLFLTALASITAGTTTVNATAHGVTSTYIGYPVAIRGAGPSGTVWVSSLDAIPDANTLTISTAAHTTVAGQDMTVGASCRRGIEVQTVEGITINNNDLYGVGAESTTIATEPDAAAIWWQTPETYGSIQDNNVIYPSGGLGNPAVGIRVVNVIADDTRINGNLFSSNWTEKIFDYSNLVIAARTLVKDTRVGPETINPDASAGTYGTAFEITPTYGEFFTSIPWCTIEATIASADTLTVRVSAVFHDGGTRQLTNTFNVDGQQRHFSDGSMIALDSMLTFMTRVGDLTRAWRFEVQSDVGSSASFARVWFRGTSD